MTLIFGYSILTSDKKFFSSQSCTLEERSLVTKQYTAIPKIKECDGIPARQLLETLCAFGVAPKPRREE
ncbi:hypothetical protein [Nostoc sp. JL33]|uniref:hypothetical protein n=1 Tax=Nostoc sp. JL33 TaxID=2815396 RepID=UPI0025F56ED9|nr:hypothetical protein [Nostoc sp. JL33]